MLKFIFVGRSSRSSVGHSASCCVVLLSHIRLLGVEEVELQIHTLYNSLQHVLNILSLLCLHWLSPGNGFQRRSFLSFRDHFLTCRRLSHN
jgi:hypothetical protein